MKRQRKFNTQLDIQVAILQQKQRLLDLIREAEIQERAIKSNFDQANDPKCEIPDFYRNTGFEIRKERGKNLRAIRRIGEVILPALKEASAQMSTIPFPFSEDDKSVVVHEH